jgi:hypothetical protein
MALCAHALSVKPLFELYAFFVVKTFLKRGLENLLIAENAKNAKR